MDITVVAMHAIESDSDAMPHTVNDIRITDRDQLDSNNSSNSSNNNSSSNSSSRNPSRLRAQGRYRRGTEFR